MSDDPWRVAFRQMTGVFSELDKNQIVLKLRGARQLSVRRQAAVKARKPYRHREGEQAVIARMRQLRSEGLAYHRIAERLNEAGIATRTRGTWRPQTAHQILQRSNA